MTVATLGEIIVQGSADRAVEMTSINAAEIRKSDISVNGVNGSGVKKKLRLVRNVE
jgi:hypothetical protein